VGGGGPWANAFPGQKTKDALGLSGAQTDAKNGTGPEKPRRGLGRTTYLEQVGDSAVEYVQAQDLGVADASNDDFEYQDEDIFAGMKNRGVDAKRRATQAYFDFCLEVKGAARARRRLLSVVLGSLQLAIDRQVQEIRLREAAEGGKDRPERTLLQDSVARGGSADVERAAQNALDTVPSTTEQIELTDSSPASSSSSPIEVGPDVVKKLISSWRLQGALPKDSLDRLCEQLPMRNGVCRIDLRALERALRTSIGPRGLKDSRKIVALVQPKPKPIMSLEPPKLPGSKLEFSKKYRPPSHALQVKRSRRRWDADSFDATSLFILPLNAPPS
jgi:hypothetical protein